MQTAFPHDWVQFAAMLTVLTILGSIFTWIVSTIIAKKNSDLLDSIRETYVSKENFKTVLGEIDRTAARHELTFTQVWQSINEVRNK